MGEGEGAVEESGGIGVQQMCPPVPGKRSRSMLTYEKASLLRTAAICVPCLVD